MSQWNHAFDFAFEVISDDEDPSDVKGADLRAALKARIDSLSDTDLVNVCNPFDSFKTEDDGGLEG